MSQNRPPLRPENMTPKQYAKWLYVEKGFDFDIACSMADWNPHEEYKEALHTFLFAAIAIGAVVFALWAVPFAHASEQPQLTEKAMLSCLNTGGMLINGELWLCTPTGMKP